MLTRFTSRADRSFIFFVLMFFSLQEFNLNTAKQVNSIEYLFSLTNPLISQKVRLTDVFIYDLDLALADTGSNIGLQRQRQNHHVQSKPCSTRIDSAAKWQLQVCWHQLAR